MIWESWPWKRELFRIASRLEKRKQQKKWPEPSLAKVEMEMFFAAYSLRKLFEAAKISDNTTTSQFDVKVYDFIGTNVTKLNWHKIDKHYDLTKSVHSKKEALFICNQLIHSYVFVLLFEETGGLSGIYFCSDRERHKHLYLLDIDDLISYLVKVSQDEPHTIKSVFNEKKRDYDEYIC
ncbi:MAG: hypothetical protein HQL06_00525 [Nitrospirae bacterium]|nr:hypothetical protein [Nitrospirota bacterium]